MNIKDIKNLFYDLIFPKKCVGCGQFGNWLCEKCFKKIIVIKSPFCPSCHRLTPQGQYCYRCRPHQNLTGVIIAAHYENPLKEAIHKFKYDKIRELAEPLSEILIERLADGFPRGDFVLVPIPLSRQREAERGFNQAEILAKKIGKAFEIPVCENVLRKIKNVAPQMKLKRSDRLENIKGVFSLRQNVEKIKNKTILLVDDVMTTGATLNEAGGVLKKAGAKNVWGLVLAKG